jgi:N-acetylneuraminic acid mutarotase
MSKSVAAMLVLLFMVTSCIVVAKPVFSSAEVAEDAWATKASMQQARAGLGVVAVNGKIYAIGGYAENGVVGTNDEYDPETDTWTYKTSMPTPMAEFATAVYKNKLYCIRENVNEVYDPATDTWETKAPMPEAQWVRHANVVGGKIYTIGGAPNKTLNQVYDPATDTWTTKASMPIDAGGASVVFDNKIYVIGGFFDEQTINFKTFTQIYDPETDTWSLGKPPTTFVVYGFAEATSGVMAPKRIYVLGWPYGDSAVTPGDPLYTNQVYDPERDSWVVGASIPTRRLAFGVAVVNDLLYVIGGLTETFDMFWNSNVTLYATNEQYTPFGYGTVPPEIAVVSPEHKTYTSGIVSLAFAVNKPAAWMGYSLDGQDNVTVTGNTTITGLSSGLHNVTVYARDEFGNTGASETVCFTIAEEPFQVAPVAVASIATVAVVGVGLLVYFKKRKHQTKLTGNKETPIQSL